MPCPRTPGWQAEALPDRHQAAKQAERHPGVDLALVLGRRLAVIDRFQDFTRGVVSARDLVFFASFIVFWLYLNTVIVERTKAG